MFIMHAVIGPHLEISNEIKCILTTQGAIKVQEVEVEVPKKFSLLTLRSRFPMLTGVNMELSGFFSDLQF